MTWGIVCGRTHHQVTSTFRALEQRKGALVGQQALHGSALLLQYARLYARVAQREAQCGVQAVTVSCAKSPAFPCAIESQRRMVNVRSISASNRYGPHVAACSS